MTPHNSPCHCAVCGDSPGPSASNSASRGVSFSPRSRRASGGGAPDLGGGPSGVTLNSECLSSSSARGAPGSAGRAGGAYSRGRPGSPGGHSSPGGYGPGGQRGRGGPGGYGSAGHGGPGGYITGGPGGFSGSGIPGGLGASGGRGGAGRPKGGGPGRRSLLADKYLLSDADADALDEPPSVQVQDEEAPRAQLEGMDADLHKVPSLHKNAKEEGL